MDMNKKDHAEASIPLFRNEATEAATHRLGIPVRAQGLGLWLVTGFILLLLFLMAAFLMATSFPRKETVAGSLVPSRGLLMVVSQRSGVVSTVHVDEGTTVRSGEPIVTVSVDSVIGSGESTGAALSSVAEQLTQAADDRERATSAATSSQESGARERMLGIERQLAALRESAPLYARQLGIAEKTMEDLGLLRADKLVSELQYRDAEVRVLTVKQSMSELHSRIALLEQERAQARHELDRLGAEREAGRAVAMSERLSSREKAINYTLQTRFDLVAPSAGQITSLQAKPGAAVTAGRTLGVIMPAGSKLLAEVWVPSSAIAFVDIGTEVRLMYDAFPYQKFGVGHAKVIKVARSPTAAEELPVELKAMESQYRLLAELDNQQMLAYGEEHGLTPGMRFKADLILERRSLLDWLLEPLLAAKRRQE